MRGPLGRPHMIPMAAIGFTLFDTALGQCALAGGEAGLVGVWLPETTEAGLRRRIPPCRITTEE